MNKPPNHVTERFDDIVREYIDFVNQQVGAYMDALAGFAGHYTRVERQVHRILRSTASQGKGPGDEVVVWASYEDPAQPDIIHNRILRASDYLMINALGGSNEQQHARAILIFLFTFWEDEIRPRIAVAKGVRPKEIRSDIMGDLRIIRNAILHSKSVIRSDKHKNLKILGDMFAVDQPLHISCEDIHKIFVLIKQDCAQLLLEWAGVENAPVQHSELVDVAIQRLGRAKP